MHNGAQISFFQGYSSSDGWGFKACARTNATMPRRIAANIAKLPELQ